MRAEFVSVDPIFGCHLWTGRKDKDGYGLLSGWKRAHIAAWEAKYGAVPEGKRLDHECRRRNCCNTDHLEPVDQSENEKRKSWRRRVKRTTCKRGHDLKLSGAVTPEGGIVCRRCNQACLSG